MSLLREISFTEAYSIKIQEIRDVVTGRKKIKEINFGRDEEINDNYEQKIEKLFETLHKKILHLNLSEGESLAKIPNEPSQERKDVASTSLAGKQWYDGTWYTCRHCAETIYGGLAFKKHLKTNHNLQSKDLMNFVEFSSDHKELAYACLSCEETVNHQFNSIYDHLRRKHSLSIGEYESQFLKKPKNKPLKIPVVNIQKLNSSELEKYSVSSQSQNSRKPLTFSSPRANEKIHKNVEIKQAEADGKPLQEKSPRSVISKKRKSPGGTEVREPEKIVAPEKEITEEEILVVYEAPVATTPPPAAIRKKWKTLYYCPVTDTGCPFYTVKEGFNDGTAAAHLSQVHKIRKQGMKPGDYKFRRVKTEIF